MRILEICTLRQFILIILHWIFQFCICVIIFIKNKKRKQSQLFRWGWGNTWQQAKEGKTKLASNHKPQAQPQHDQKEAANKPRNESNGLQMGCVLVLGGVPAALLHSVTLSPSIV